MQKATFLDNTDAKKHKKEKVDLNSLSEEFQRGGNKYYWVWKLGEIGILRRVLIEQNK